MTARQTTGPAIDLAGRHQMSGWGRISVAIVPQRWLETVEKRDALRDDLRAACRFMGLAGNAEWGVDGRTRLEFAMTGPGLVVAEPLRLIGALSRVVSQHCGPTSTVRFGDALAIALVRAPAPVAAQMAAE